MPPEPEDEPELSEIEAALGSLVPSRSRVDRDRVMYQAGRASSRPAPSGRRPWIAVAASLGLVALGEAALLARAPSERVVFVREPAPSPAGPALEVASVRPPASGPRPPGPSPDLGPGAHNRLAWQVLRYGLDGLPAPSPSAGGGDLAPWPAPSRRILREEIGKVLDLGDPS